MKMIRGGILLLAAMAAAAVFGASDLVEGVIDRSGSGDVVVGNWAPQASVAVAETPAGGGGYPGGTEFYNGGNGGSGAVILRYRHQPRGLMVIYY